MLVSRLGEVNDSIKKHTISVLLLNAFSLLVPVDGDYLWSIRSLPAPVSAHGSGIDVMTKYSMVCVGLLLVAGHVVLSVFICKYHRAERRPRRGAWALFANMVVWQHPHFTELVWLYRDAYRRAGFWMLSVIDDTGKRTLRPIVIFNVVLIAVSMWPVVLGMTGWIYFGGAFRMGVIMLMSTVLFWLRPNADGARRVFFESLIDLALLCGLPVFRC